MSIKFNFTPAILLALVLCWAGCPFGPAAILVGGVVLLFVTTERRRY